MSFTPGIPASGQSLGSSRIQVLNNFLNAVNTMAVNHIFANDPGAGKHKFMQMPEQAASPGTAVNEMAIYTKDVAGISEFFLQRENLAAAGADIQMSSGNPKQGSTANYGQSFLPGGFQIKWGIGSQGSGSSKGIVYTGVGLDNFPTNTVNVIVCGNTNSEGVVFNSSNQSKTGFTALWDPAAGVNFFWIAIGY